MLFILILMAYAAAGISSVREDEAQGYLDNFLVQPVSRMRWLWGRLSLIVIIIVITGSLSGIVVWLGMVGHHDVISLHSLILSGLNIIPAALFTLGLGIFTLGLVPRLTAVISYGVIALSFLVVLVSSGLHLNHWLLDISILNHVALAPAVDPNWRSASVLLALGVVLALVGAAIFDTRDLQPE